MPHGFFPFVLPKRQDNPHRSSRIYPHRHSNFQKLRQNIFPVFSRLSPVIVRIVYIDVFFTDLTFATEPMAIISLTTINLLPKLLLFDLFYYNSVSHRCSFFSSMFYYGPFFGAPCILFETCIDIFKESLENIC